jgi:hypothetical protein
MRGRTTGLARSIACGWRRQLAVLGPALLLAFACGPQLGGGSASAIEVGDDRLRVVLDFEDPQVAEQTLAAVEAAWAAGHEAFGAPRRPSRSRTVYLHRTEAAYEEACDRFVGGRFKRNGAFSSHETGDSHVLLQPNVSDPVLTRIGLPGMTRRLVVHEVAHLAMYETFAHFRSHPDWLSEGATQWVERLVERAAGGERSPWTEAAAERVRRLLEGERLPAVESIVDDALSAYEFYERYALCEVFYAFLAEERERALESFLKRLRSVKRLPTGREGTKQIAALLWRALGDREGIDEAFRAFIARQPVRWYEVSRSLEPHGSAEWIQSAFPGSSAIAFRRDQPLQPPFRIAGRLSVLPGSTVPQGNVLLGRVDDTSYTHVALREDLHSVTVFRRRGAEWSAALAEARAPGLSGEDVAFTVEVDAERMLTVEIAGEVVLRHRLAEDEVVGQWGLGVQGASSAIWSEVVATGDPPDESR